MTVREVWPSAEELRRTCFDTLLLGRNLRGARLLRAQTLHWIGKRRPDGLYADSSQGDPYSQGNGGAKDPSFNGNMIREILQP